MAIGKNDQQARQHWGSESYDSIPKSVFALAAWHLANVSSGTCDAEGAAEQRFIEEIEALAASGILDQRQAKIAAKAVRV